MIAVTGVVLLLLSRGHYSIDCLLAYWVTSRVWWTYHTLANNNILQEQGAHNHLDNIWWWWLLRWAEANVPGQLPRRYSLPAPASVQRAATGRPPFALGRSRGNRDAAAGGAGAGAEAGRPGRAQSPAVHASRPVGAAITSGLRRYAA